jgi:hypothetical protein
MEEPMTDAEQLEDELRTTLTPVEKAVLATCEQLRTRLEIQTDLSAEFNADTITSTIAFLKRRRLLEAWRVDDAEDRVTREPLAYKQTIIGEMLLRAQRRAEAQALLPRTPPRRLPSRPRDRGLRLV